MNVKDHYGVPFVKGNRVAFNYQGQVRIGIVVEVKEATKYGKTHNFNGEKYCVIKVAHSDNLKQISKITSRFNVVNL